MASAAQRAANKRWRAKNRETWNAILAQGKRTRRAVQAGTLKPTVCEICEEERETCFDHCHRGGHFRGWLCHRCNRVLGCVADDPELLGKMAAYLRADVERNSFSRENEEEADV